MEPEPRQLFNIHNLCIVKHASKVSYMQIQPKRFYDHTQHTYTHTHNCEVTQAKIREMIRNPKFTL